MLLLLLLFAQRIPVAPAFSSARLWRFSSRRTPPDTSAARKAAPPGGGDFGELTSALATLDQQWQIRQRSSVGDGKPEWSRLFLPKNDKDENENDKEDENAVPEPGLPLSDDYVWMLEPPNKTIPSCIVVFTGGAGLGQFPQVAYNELLSEVSSKLNALCLTVPYEVGLDHFSLAKSTGERLRRALLLLRERREDLAQQNLPTYSLAHSLGCKLQTIYLAATGLDESFAGVGFVAYNNFSFGRTISMARTFAQELRSGSSSSNNNDNNGNNPMGGAGPPDEMINSLFDFAEMAVGAMGVEFSPTPQDTERLVQLRYNDKLQAKTRIFRFGSDQLDSSRDFRTACESFVGSDNSDNSDSGETTTTSSTSTAPGVSFLDGGHLTPVFFRWDADDLAGEGLGESVPPEAFDMAREAMGGFRGASFGDEAAFGALVDEVCDWILGRPPRTVPLPQIESGGGGDS